MARALPFTWFTELLDESTIRASLGFSRRLDERFGRTTTAARLTDVPGHSRGLIRPLAEAGVSSSTSAATPGASHRGCPSTAARSCSPRASRRAGPGQPAVARARAGPQGPQRREGTRWRTWRSRAPTRRARTCSCGIDPAGDDLMVLYHPLVTGPLSGRGQLGKWEAVIARHANKSGADPFRMRRPVSPPRLSLICPF